MFMRILPSLLALRAFEAAARYENFALAGEELHLTPSAISHQVKALETYFAQPLFIRRSRRVELTADGRRLLSKLTTAFDAIEIACGELKPAGLTQSLAIHCTPSFASKWLGPRLPSFMQQHPAISIRMTASADEIDLLRHEELDLMITYGSAPQGPGISYEALGTELITALCAPSLAAAVAPAELTDLSSMSLIESAVSPVRWRDWCAVNKLGELRFRSMQSFDRGALAVSAAVQGIGIALETTRFVQEELAKGDLVEFGKNHFHGIRREMHFLCYRTLQRDLPKIKGFRDWLIEHSMPK